MSYAQDIGSLRFLAANVIYQATGALLRPDTGDEADRGVLDDASLMLDVISSYHTENDPSFKAEWQGIQKRRGEAMAAVPAGHELSPDVLESLRWAELRSMFRSLCRAGKFERQDSPESSWIPQGARP